jgi:hypothetical protein
MSNVVNDARTNANTFAWHFAIRQRPVNNNLKVTITAFAVSFARRRLR